jgi:hypothetical protein
MKELGLETPPEMANALERMLEKKTGAITCAEALLHVRKSRFFSKEKWRTWVKKMRLKFGEREFADAERAMIQKSSREERETLGKG